MAPKGGLGKGLASLIPGQQDSLRHLPLEQIVANSRQPRKSFEDGALKELEVSIRAVGVLQPLVVRESGGVYELVLGERRLRAARSAGLASVPALVIDTDDRGSLQRALIENVQREGLNALEEAHAFAQLVEEGGLTHDELAAQVGKSRPTISNSLRLLELPARIQEMVARGRLSAGHARAFLGLQRHPMQERLAERVVTEGMSVRETEALVRRYSIEESQHVPAKDRRSGKVLLVEVGERLSEALASPVRIEMGKRGGRISIRFASAEDLDRIVARMAALQSKHGSIE